MSYGLIVKRQPALTAAENYALRRRRRRSRIESAKERLTLAAVCHHEALLRILHEFRSAKRAAGPEGVAAAEMTASQLAQLARVASSAVTSRRYRVGPVREVRIPKARGGYRSIAISNLADAAIATAVHQAVSPIVDPLFSDMSYGFRPRRDRMQLLAAIATTAVRDNCYYTAHVDVTAAFDTAPIDASVDALRQLVVAAPEYATARTELDELLRLIDLVARGGRRNVERGLRQGCPLSPLILNCLLHFAVDVSEDASTEDDGPETHVWRYADDIVIQARTAEAANAAIGVVGRRLEAIGMPLRQVAAPANLRGEHGTTILGFGVSLVGKEVQLSVNRGAYEELAHTLAQTWETSPRKVTLMETLGGWIDQVAPGIDGGRLTEVCRDILRQAHIRVAIEYGELVKRLRTSRSRWTDTLQRAWIHANQKSQTIVDDDGAAVSTDRPLRRRESRVPSGAASPRTGSHFYRSSVREQELLARKRDASQTTPLQVFTDGAALRNPGPGGWGVVIDDPIDDDIDELSGSVPHATNNQMELIAVMEALRAIDPGMRAFIWSDSTYVVDSIRKGRVAEWERRGWRGSRGHFANSDLWQALLALLEHRRIEFRWVRGHDRSWGNDAADRLARQAIENVRQPV